MAGQDSQEKTEKATPKRLREARKKGQVAKSKDLTMVFVMILVFMIIAITLKSIAVDLKDLMHLSFSFVEKNDLNGKDILSVGKSSFIVLAKVLSPILIAGFVGALIINFLQVGAIFSGDPLIPKFEKLNPIEGFKNMFKMVTLIELVKNLAKLGVVFYIAYSTIRKYLQEVLLSSQVGMIDAVSLSGTIVYAFFTKVSAIFFTIALIDMGVQRWNFMKNMRMGKEEIKREYKEDEGDPRIKGERKRLHRDMVFGDVKKNVKKSDAIVTNPTHVAVAIQYNSAEMGAPEIMAKGQRQFAELILEIAREEKVPIVRNIPLAWALLQLEVGDAIPEDLFEPVAEVLSFVYDLKKAETEKAAGQNVRKESPTPFNPIG